MMDQGADIEEVLEDSMKSYMRKRIFGLLLTNFLEDLELKRIKVEVGEQSELDLSRKEFEDAFKLNTLESISHVLLDDIMPLIEKKPSFFSTRERKVVEKEIRGMIDWPRTFKRNLSQGQIFGKEFVVVNPRQEWDTPENLLSMLCLLEITKNTSYFKRSFRKSIETSHWTKNILEERVLDAIAQEGYRRTRVPYFRRIEEEVEEILEDPDRIREIEEEFERRLQLNLIRNPGYEKVLDWRKELTGRLDVQKESTRILRDIPGKGEEYLSKVYELWALFEISDVMEDQLTMFRYYSDPGSGPMFTGTLSNPDHRGDERENIRVELYYLPVKEVVQKIWPRRYEGMTLIDVFFPPDAGEHRAIQLCASSDIEISPGEKRRVQVNIGFFPRFIEVPDTARRHVDITAIPLHPSEDREVFNRKLLNNLTKYIRGMPYSSESKGIVLHPATWTPSVGTPGTAISEVEAD